MFFPRKKGNVIIEVDVIHVLCGFISFSGYDLFWSYCKSQHFRINFPMANALYFQRYCYCTSIFYIVNPFRNGLWFTYSTYIDSTSLFIIILFIIWFVFLYPRKLSLKGEGKLQSPCPSFCMCVHPQQIFFQIFPSN